MTGHQTRTPALLPQIAYFSTYEIPIVPEPTHNQFAFRPSTFHLQDENDDDHMDFIQTNAKSDRRSFQFTSDIMQLRYRYRTTMDQMATEQLTSAFTPAAPTWPVANFGTELDSS